MCGGYGVPGVMAAAAVGCRFGGDMGIDVQGYGTKGRKGTHLCAQRTRDSLWIRTSLGQTLTRTCVVVVGP